MLPPSAARFELFILITCFFVFGTLHQSIAQEEPKQQQQQLPQETQEKQEEALEQLSGQDETQRLDYDNLVDLATLLSRHPLNLNRVDQSDLRALMDLQLLNEIQINSILKYREQMGNFISIYELQAVPYLDVPTIRAILPFVTVTTDIGAAKIPMSELLARGDYTILVRASQILEEQKGYSPSDSNSTSRYLGSPLNLYTRYRYTYGTKFGYGITGQKDAGEQFFNGTQKQGYDFYSAHAFYRGNGFVKNAVIGDYTVNFGEGLILGSGYGVYKSSYITSIKNSSRPLRAYTSVDEFNFFRGGAVTAGSKHLNVTLFGSYKKIDGNIVTVDTIDENNTVTSIGGDGYHRTESEVADKNTVTQRAYGANIEYAKRTFSAGGTFFHTDFSVPIEPTYQPYNIYAFRGDQLSNYGAHFTWQYRNFNFFGEGALSDPGGFGGVAGLLMSVDRRVDLALLYRNYAKDFYSAYANAFGESSTNTNERGLYAGIVIRPARGWELNAYADFFKKPWLAYQVDAPSLGTDFLLQLNYKPSKVFSMYFRYRDKSKQQNSSLNDEPLDYVVSTEQQNFRFHFEYKASPSFTFRSRAEWVLFEEEKVTPAHGFLVYQDVIFRQLRFPLQLTGRFCLFDGDTYDSRIYAYENEVLYVYSVPAFYNRGIRWYLMARYTVTRGVDLWVRYAQIYYTNIDVIGNGLDEINGNTKSELKAELRLRF
jgi:DNA uptake protein ComE-like DNA-binding protein